MYNKIFILSISSLSQFTNPMVLHDFQLTGNQMLFSCFSYSSHIDCISKFLPRNFYSEFTYFAQIEPRCCYQIRSKISSEFNIALIIMHISVLVFFLTSFTLIIIKLTISTRIWATRNQINICDKKNNHTVNSTEISHFKETL